MAGPEPADERACVHRVDAADRITFVNPRWITFAKSNGADSLPDRVFGTSLWTHIRGAETHHLYQVLLRQVRREGRPKHFPFRCDSPQVRRFMHMTIRPADDHQVDFCILPIREEPRERIALLDVQVPRSDNFVIMCGWCQRVKADRWVEVEEAIASLNLFDRRIPPQISHGLCGHCKDKIMAEAG